MSSLMPSTPNVRPSVAIVGAGAIGCRLAAAWAGRGVACALFDGWDAHVAAIARDGLQWVEGGQVQQAWLPAASWQAACDDRFDRVIVSVRSDQTAAIAPFAASLLRPDGLLVSCQNGINEDTLAAVAGVERLYGCTMVYGARLVVPGRFEVLPGEDTFRVGAWDPRSAPRAVLDELVPLFGLCGHASRTDNLPGYRWMKLALNAMANPLLLLTGMTAAELHAQPLARALMRAITQEVLAAAAVLGVRVEPPLGLEAACWQSSEPQDIASIDQRLQRHGDELGARRLSMVADFQARGRTEVDHINGRAAQALQAAGLPAPLNLGVVRLVHAVESGQRAITPHHLNELASLMPATSH